MIVQDENPAPANATDPNGAAQLAQSWKAEGFTVNRPDTALKPNRGMAFWDAVVAAAVYEKTQMLAAIRCACIGGLLFAALAFYLCLILTAATTDAPNPTYILWAAILGIIVGIIVSFVLRRRYRSFAKFLCMPGHMGDSMKSAIAGHEQAERYTSAIFGPDNKAGLLRGDVVHLGHLLHG